jgi:hypothetical protein
MYLFNWIQHIHAWVCGWVIIALSQAKQIKYMSSLDRLAAWLLLCSARLTPCMAAETRPTCTMKEAVSGVSSDKISNCGPSSTSG